MTKPTAKSGRKPKTLIRCSKVYAIGVDGTAFTIEKYSTSGGWTPVSWPFSLVHAVRMMLEILARDHIVATLGAGVSDITEEAVAIILKELNTDAVHIIGAVIDADLWVPQDVLPRLPHRGPSPSLQRKRG